MGKTIIAEESVSDYIASLYGAHQWQIGLIIGQLTSQRDYIIHLAKTPDQSANTEGQSEESSRDEIKKPRSIGDVDENWAIEHSHQVSRMLTGGLDIIGVFAFGPSDMLTKFQAKLRQLMFSIYKATNHKINVFFDDEDTVSSRIILQICSQTKRTTCRTLDVSDIKSTAQPADLKFQSFLNRWTNLETSVLLELEFKVPRKLEKSSLNTKIMDSLETPLLEITNAVCTINGTLQPNDQLLAPSEKQVKSSHQASKSSHPTNVELYLEKLCTSSRHPEQDNMGTILIQGTIQCKACVNQKATCGDAILAVKRDVIRSILSRFDVLCDDILDAEAQQKTESLENTWTCPQRVFVPLGKGPIRVCDYMFQDETIQDSLDRVAELLSVSSCESDVECRERIPNTAELQDTVAELKSRKASREKLVTSSDNHQSGVQNKSRGTYIGAIAGILTAVAAAAMAWWGGEVLG